MECRIKLVIENGGKFFLGPGIVSLLQQIDAQKSVARASEVLGLSYSKAWKMIRDAESGSGVELVVRTSGGTGGGGASLTEHAEKALAAYSSARESVARFADEAVRKLSFT